MMHLKTALIALALTALPGLALAECEWKKQSVSQCPQGQTFDDGSHACVPIASS